MRLLAIDTSTDYLNLAVTDGDEVLGRIHRLAPMAHSRLLTPMIVMLLKKLRLGVRDIDGFCISVGPGSFTGLRIGVSAVKGFACVLKKPVVAVPTLDAVADNVKKFKGIICTVLDARKNKVYACIYRSDGRSIKRVSEYLLVPVEDLTKRLSGFKDDIVYTGDASELVGKAMHKDWQPKPEAVARIGIEMFKKRKFIDPEDLEPLYLYSKECDITGK